MKNGVQKNSMNKKVILILCSCVITVYAATMSIINPLLSDMATDFGINLSNTGLLYTAYFSGSMCFLLFAGSLTHRLGKKLLSKLLIFLFPLCGFLVSISPNIPTVFASLFLLGGTGSLMQSVLYAIPSDIYPEQSVRLLTLINVFFSFGAVCGLYFSGLASGSGLSWRLSYAFTAALMLILSIVYLFMRYDEAPRIEAKHIGKLNLAFFKNPVLVISMIAVFFYVGAETSLTGWLALYLKTDLTFTPAQSSAAVSLVWGAMGVSRMVYAKLSEKFSSRILVVFAASCTLFSSLLVPFTKTAGMVWVVCILIGFSLSATWPLIAATGSANMGHNTVTAMSMIMVSGSLGISVIPYLIGVGAENFGMRAAMFAPPLCFAIIVLLFGPIMALFLKKK